MLRSGYSVPTIEAELATRHFADQLDEAKRNQLIKAGATSQLLNGIESGKFNRTREEREAAEFRRAWPSRRKEMTLCTKTNC